MQCFYFKVLVPMEPEYMGKMVDVRIVSASKFSLMSEPVSRPQRPDVPEALERGQVSGLASSKSKGNSKSMWPVIALSGVVALRIAWALFSRRR